MMFEIDKNRFGKFLAEQRKEKGYTQKDLAKKVLTLSDETPEKKRQFRRKNILIYLGAVMVTCLIMLVIHQLGITSRELSPASYIYEILNIVFGAYFWIFIREKLPAYFDENKISAYSDGFFRMNIPGVHFNNNNWPHIVHAGRLWTICSMILCPVIQLCGFMILKEDWSTSVSIHMVLLFLFLYLGTLFIPMIVVGKKYE